MENNKIIAKLAIVKELTEIARLTLCGETREEANKAAKSLLSKTVELILKG